MKTVKHIILAASALFIGLGTLHAQDFQTGYFLGGYQYGYRLNPAFQNAHGFVSLGFGQSGMTANSNLGIDNFLFVKDNKTVLFLNDKVSSQEFLKGISKGENNISYNLNVNILAVGFWVKRNFFNIDLNIKANGSVTLPYDLFRFLKDGTSNGNTFNLAGTGVRSKNYVELAVGWSRNWNNFITGGARIKTLVGIAEAQAYMTKLDVTMAKDKWSIAAQGALNGSSPMLQLGVGADGSYDYSQLGFGFNKVGPAGYGGAVDLGVVINPLPWVTASVSILDLGLMVWNREINGTTPEAAYTWDPSQGQPISINGDGGGMNQELEKMKEALANIYKFNPSAATGPKAEMLPMRLLVGAEVRLPWWDRLSLGLLYSGRYGQGFNWNEGRISLNVSPLNWLSLSGSTSFNDFFRSFGVGLNVHPGIINFFIGTDVIPGRIIPANSLVTDMSFLPSFLGIPTSDLNINGYFGISIAWGKRKVDYKRNYIERED